ncbi:GFA family protein [Defluviimonas sp. WL0024]|uniref:GFA family protein n=2 Tax=Albidovulum TaxID=205889 RepID=A0ABT3J444_9RHOB|nr:MULTISPECIES: GFA family protein [Defluviimonas]MCU9850528.1 GFA family protein [Defluviimonas sp. WL0024]MCW3782465.1 GFA family protein [Defluviimonas salinarum]
MTHRDATTAGLSANDAAVLTGACFCGAVEIRATGAPVEMGYCHCGSCRAYSGAPFVTYALFAEHQVTVTQGVELLGLVNRTGMSARRFCRCCGGHVMTEHPGMGFTDIHASVLPELHFWPVWHLNYAEAVLPVRDGLPKLKDFPAHAGGTGETLAE